MQYTLEKEGDRFFLIDPGEKEGRFIANIEWQVANDQQMPGRMLLYHALRFQQDQLPVKGYVIYVGDKPLNMCNHVQHFRLQYSYEIIDLKGMDSAIFLTSNLPDELIMAVLAGDTTGEAKREIVRKILYKLRLELGLSDHELSRRITQLKALSKLRNIEKIVIEEEKDMPTLYEIYKELEARPSKVRITQKMIIAEEIKHEKQRFVTRLVKETDHSDEKIAGLAEVSLEFVGLIRHWVSCSLI